MIRRGIPFRLICRLLMVDVSVYNHSPHSPHTVESGDVSLEWERYQVIEKALKSFREVLPLVLQ